MKHTPGPWIVIPSPDPEVTNISIQSYSTPSLWVASVHGSHVDTPDDQMNANAKLIAAAPDMLDALQSIVGIEAWIEDQELRRVFTEKVYPVIAKATK